MTTELSADGDGEEEHEHGLEHSDEQTIGCELNHSCEVWQMEYHILYSESYGVPVLYFNAYKNGRCILTINA